MMVEGRQSEIRAKRTKVVGLMSGTSADGVDAALVEIAEGEGGPDLRLVAHRTVPYPEGLRARVLAAMLPPGGTVDEICHLNAYLGELFARAASTLISESGLAPADVALIGSHGQTVHHLPSPRDEAGIPVRSTLQIAQPAIIAERTGITTIADFRPRDMAGGGEGAPLGPVFHDVLFRHPERDRVVVNFGGIANLTWLPGGPKFGELLAFDTGPGNVLIDGLAAYLSDAAAGMDRDGVLAGRGQVWRPLLDELMEHPFLRRRPPKSTGREEFGPGLLGRTIARATEGDIPDKDLMATLTAFTAESVALAIERFLPPAGAAAELVACGGGARNPTLVRMLRERLPTARLTVADALGFPGAAMESAAFALLAYLTATGRPGNVPTATGAARPVVLGAIVPGRGYRGLW
jgi:anhydro-N-acetylmuramic acid kinase